jgi:hypothetical protein
MQGCLGLNEAKYQLTMFSHYGSLLSDGSEEAASVMALAFSFSCRFSLAFVFAEG